MPTIICFRRYAIAALVAANLLISGCGGGGSSDVAGAGDLVVRVADARDSSVSLAGATVKVTAGTTSKTAITPADGTVTFQDLPAGAAAVVVTRDLYREYNLTGNVQGAGAVGLTALLQRRTGTVNVLAVDKFAAPVPNVQVQVSVEGQTIAAVTGATGVANLAGVPTATVSVQAAANGFLPEPALSVIVVESPAASLQFTLDRQTGPAGGVVTPQPGTPPTPADNGQSLTFRIRSVVLNGQGQAIEDRQAADFTLVACADATPSQAECVRSPSDPAFDSAYVPVRATADAFARLPGGAPVPYAVALGFDQSGSISDSDPTDARVFASKGFLQTVSSGDRVVLAAFAEGTDARIPTRPLTIYGTFTSDGEAFFDELDQFPLLEGGGTPLYQALDGLLRFTGQNAPANVPGQRKAVVVFSDGFDTVCANPAACRETTIDLSRTLGVDIFTVGLAGSVDTPTLAEIAYRANGAHLVAQNPEQLSAIYGSLGPLLRGSITTYETTWTVRAPSSGVFVPGRSVLGVLRVNTGSTILELPFLYVIP